jgi:hypothetical protein
MSTVDAQIRSVDETICTNIETLRDNRGLLSQNMLSQLRNLVEGVAVLVHTRDGNTEYDYEAIKAGLKFIKSRGEFAFLKRFHASLEASASHYAFDGHESERLMLKYYEYLHRLRTFMRDALGIGVLANLESFPVDLDPSLREYHEKIAERIVGMRRLPMEGDTSSRYYVEKTRPFFVDGTIFYEVTFTNPIDRISKSDRIIAFTDQDVGDKYAATLTLRSDSIEVFGQIMPITIIRAWEVSIRPCELNNFARFFGPKTNVSTRSTEYRLLMRYLTVTGSTLVDLVDLPGDHYEHVKSKVTARDDAPRIFPILDTARIIIQHKNPGYVMLRYLMLRMRNVVLRQQYRPEQCSRLSGLRLGWGCIPFDEMPFCTSPLGHNPRYWDLVEALDPSGRTYELLARRVKNNVDRRGMLYTPVSDLAPLGDLASLIKQYNDALYWKHRETRSLDVAHDHVFIRGYENSIVQIVEELQRYATLGVGGWEEAINHWLDERPNLIDDSLKADALKSLFKESRVALIYGSAGTGKSTMVNYIANYFNQNEMLFLANTHPAVDNLRRRVQTQNAEFRTIASHNLRTDDGTEYDIVVIDECSTVSNESMLRILEQTRFKLLVLVGDVYQIESIQFGNWFSIMRSFVPDESVFELTTPYRTSNAGLLELWRKVRNLEDGITEAMVRGGYSAVLGPGLFESQGIDEIVLCLNYDGLYGINNINRFLQSSNPNAAVPWGPSTYKVGDPVLFTDTERFKPVIFNNLKGTIVGINRDRGKIRFEVDLDRDVTEFSVFDTELEWVHDSVVAFDVFELANSDEEEEILNTSVPFQVAYAVSIHKAQGLEYDSVKVVVTDANEDDISHSIFYTALTRAREKLQVFWTPETQQSVIGKLERRSSTKDVKLLSSRRDLTPVR